MTELKANPPTVIKNKHVSFGKTSYSHATLAEVCDAAVAAMSKHGLSHRWEVDQSNGITVSCVITHKMGHSEATTMTAPPDDSGQKNRIQQIASTVTYLQRYTLMGAVGMASKEMDDDAKASQPEPHIETCTPEQAEELKEMIAALTDEKRQAVALGLSDYYKVTTVNELTPKGYEHMKRHLSRLIDEANA